MRGLSCPSSILDHAKKFKNHLLELNFHNSIGEIVQSEAINIDRFGERQEIIEEVNVLVCPACLFAHKQVDTERSGGWCWISPIRALSQSTVNKILTPEYY